MNDGDKGGWVELTPEEIERQENSPTRIFYFEDIEECDLRREATESRRRIAEFLEWQYWFNRM